MVKIRVSYETEAELAAIVNILGPYVLDKSGRHDESSSFSRIYFSLDPKKLAKLTDVSPQNAAL